MTVFKSFFAVSKKYIGTLIMYTCIFLGISISIAKLNNQNNIETFKSTQLNVAYFNHSDSVLAKKLIEYLSDNHKLMDDYDEDIDCFRDEIYNRNIDYVLIIPEKFEETHEVEAYKLPGSVTAQFMDLSINSFITTYSAYKVTGISDDEAYAKTLDTMALDTQINFADKSKVTTYTDEHYFFQYLPYIFTCVICLSLAPVLISFNKTEVKKRTLCSGIPLAKRNASLAAGCFIYTFGIVIFYVIISIIIYGNVVFSTAGALRVLNAVVFLLVALSFAFLLSNITSQVNAVNMYVNAIGLGSSFICGIFVPRELLASGVIAAGRFFPAYWYVNVEEAASNLSIASTSTIVTGLSVQLLFALAMMTIALVIGNRKKA